VQAAQGHVREAERLFRLGSYGPAREHFGAALEALQRVDIRAPAALYRSVARCHDQLGEVEAALANYRRFLASARPTSPNMEEAIRRATDAEGRLQRLLDRTALRFDITPREATVRLDGRILEPATLAEPVRVAPGQHKVEVEAPKHLAQTVTLGVEAGALAPLVVTLLPAPLEPAPLAPPAVGSDPAIRPPRSSGARWGAIGGGGLAVAAAVGGTGLWLRSRSLDEEGDDLLEQGFGSLEAAQRGQTDAQRRYDSAARHRYLAGGLAAMAGVALAAAAYLWWWGPTESPPPTSVAPSRAEPRWGVAVTPTPGGGAGAALFVLR